MELNHFIKLDDAVYKRSNGSTRTYLDIFDRHCSGGIVEILKKQIENDELYPEMAEKEVSFLEAISGPFRPVKSRNNGFFAKVMFNDIDFFDRSKGLIYFESKSHAYYFVVRSPKSITCGDGCIIIERGEETLWGGSFRNDRAFRDWEDSVNYPTGNIPLRRRNGLRGKDYEEALVDMQGDFAEERRLLGLRAEKRLKSLKEEEEESEGEEDDDEEWRLHKKSQIDIANTHTIYVYARDKDEKGQKIDDRFKLYRVELVDYNAGAYRYSYVSARGEYKNENVNPQRLFFRTSKRTVQKSYFKDSLPFPKFVEEGALSSLLSNKSKFSESDQKIIEFLAPLFGFMDSGNVIARSAQRIVINPFLFEEDEKERPVKRKRTGLKHEMAQ